MAAAAPAPVDELVSSVTLYRRRPRLLHGTVLPFVAGLYPAWLWLWGPRVWATWGEAEEEEGPGAGPRPALPEAALLALAAIGVVHLLTALSGLWSVHAHCALTCVREPCAKKATLAKVVPTPNNGSVELVPLHRDQVRTRLSREWTLVPSTAARFSGFNFDNQGKISQKRGRSGSRGVFWCVYPEQNPTIKI
ncbi:hypothetical protein AV530_016367 [Patagioenas fasciata monilis]|uniref:P5A-ATPase transmembrane helical hairpin domain-containing protein n=1 Tax=Patagioenas fasciata monilis TaxID=372326 RepID=A0A1V4KDJ9_PATFA|nr:hypothetical protein AV530_016367 [Patagioenas fasciata monilis]